MIGIFDSGLGGLSVLAAIHRLLPHAECLYLADTAYTPYGNKPESLIRERALAIGHFLAGLGCQTVVVACNTATVAAVRALRATLPELAIVGVEPGVKPAARHTRSKHIAVLATEATARSQRLHELIERHAAGVHVSIVPCPGWATRVETLDLMDRAFAEEVGSTIQALVDQGVDQLVLGCTHYTFLQPLMQPLTQGRAELVEVAQAVAREVLRRESMRLDAMATASVATTDRRPECRDRGHIQLLATATPERLLAALPRLGLAELLSHLRGPAQLVVV